MKICLLKSAFTIDRLVPTAHWLLLQGVGYDLDFAIRLLAIIRQQGLYFIWRTHIVGESPLFC